MKALRHQSTAKAQITAAAGAILLALGGCAATSPVSPPEAYWFKRSFVPHGSFDNQCGQRRAQSGQPLQDYARRVERLDFDCLWGAEPDLPPPATAAPRYILANALLALPDRAPGRDEVDIEDFARATRLIEHPEDRGAVHMVTALLFHGVRTQSARAESYERCAKKIGFKALDLEYSEMLWLLRNNEELMSGWPPGEVECDIPQFDEFLQRM